jgi:hypothetical protein
MIFLRKLIIDGLFFLDVIINCNLAFYDEEENLLITDRKTIFKKYLKSWLIVDVVACVPF